MHGVQWRNVYIKFRLGSFIISIFLFQDERFILDAYPDMSYICGRFSMYLYIFSIFKVCFCVWAGLFIITQQALTRHV